MMNNRPEKYQTSSEPELRDYFHWKKIIPEKTLTPL